MAESSIAPIEMTHKQRVRAMKTKMGRPVSPDPDDPANNPVSEEGTVVLHKMFSRMVVLQPNGLVKKSGQSLDLQEADALKFAADAGLPVPHIFGTGIDENGHKWIEMHHVKGKPLSDVWKTLSPDGKQAVIGQMRGILAAMRSLPAPPNHIGGTRAGEQLRDSRGILNYTAPACTSEAAFNDYLIGALSDKAPPAVRNAFARQLRARTHRIVFTHGDLAPRNIIVTEDGSRIVGIIDWEDAGWYPEYWEYVKFFLRCSAVDGDWWTYIDDMISCSYPDELVTYLALVQWQH